MVKLEFLDDTGFLLFLPSAIPILSMIVSEVILTAGRNLLFELRYQNDELRDSRRSLSFFILVRQAKKS